MTSTSQHSEEGPGEWNDCQGGEIAQLAARLKQERARIDNRRNMVRMTSMAAALVCCVGIGILIWPGQKESYGSISCKQCVEMIPEYDQQELSDEMIARMENHFDRCQRCRDHYADWKANAEKGLSRIGLGWMATALASL